MRVTIHAFPPGINTQIGNRRQKGRGVVKNSQRSTLNVQRSSDFPVCDFPAAGIKRESYRIHVIEHVDLGDWDKEGGRFEVRAASGIPREAAFLRGARAGWEKRCRARDAGLAAALQI
jgi:hypothetical protein